MVISPASHLNGTIVQGKTRQLLNVAENESGYKSVIFTNEAGAVSLSINVIALSGMTKGYWELWSMAGDSANHNRLLYRSNTESGLGVRHETIQATGKLKFNVVYTGAATFEVSATGVEAIAAAKTFDVNVKKSVDDMQFRDELLNCLESINNNLVKILNHQRIITAINKDEGELF